MRNAKTDKNQREIVDGLRKMGFSVQVLSRVGQGFPDIMVGGFGRNFLFEVKSEHGRVNEKQIEWFSCWKGQAKVIRNLDEVIQEIQRGL